MRSWLTGLMLFAGICAWSDAGWSATLIVKDGQPQAQIVIAPERPRMVGLAALELQDYLEKISGARLPIVTEPGAEMPVKIYVGQSAHTDKLGINDDGLQYGAFRMVSGPDWLVLLGNDFDYHPPKPYPPTRNAIQAAQEEWDKLTAEYTDSAWKLPWGGAFKSWWNPRDFDTFMAGRYGEENLTVWNPKGLKWSRDYYAEGAGTGYWKHDEGGSLNAVYAFLRDLGLEWYMPGELGEVVPEIKTIALPDVNETSKPDFAMRSWFWYNYSAFPFDHIIWAKRLGMNNSYEVLGNIGHAHGLVNVHGHKAMREKHPEYYALKDLTTGEPPEQSTTFNVTWDQGNLIFDIKCQDNDIANLFVTDDVWGGDSVSLLLETPNLSYYQIEVNPDGTIFDADQQGKMNTRWSSLSTVKTEKGADFWRAIITVPVLPPEKNEGDPYHYVIGPKPSQDAMWYLNVGRARVRPDSRTGQAFMPTGGRYHDRTKFAKLVIE